MSVQKKSNPKNQSYGVFSGLTSTAVRSASSEDLSKLYFRTTKSDFQKWDISKTDSLGEIYQIGHKSTKHMPFKYRQAPIHDMGAFSYSQDFGTSKASDAFLNNSLAKVFSRPNQSWTGSASTHPSQYGLDFVPHKKAKGQTLNDALSGNSPPIRENGMRRCKPDMERTKILSSSDRHYDPASSKQAAFIDHPHKMKEKLMRPNDNMACTGVDTGECYNSTYGTTLCTGFKGSLSGSLSRCHTAPADISRKDRREQQEKQLAKSLDRPSTSCGGDRRKQIRLIYMKPGN